MKLTIFLLIVVFLHVSAAGYGQNGTVTISGKDLSLEKVFSVIKKQTDYVCFYGYDVLKDAKTVSLSFKNADVQEVLKAALWGQGLDFSITGKTITIMKKIVVAAFTGTVRTIKAVGVVYNEAGQPLSGANVTIKATGKGTITNAKGEFELPAVPEESTLVISFIGYAPQAVKVNEGKAMQVFLITAKNELDKVVVQAYGTTTQRLATGNIATVRADEIERQPVINPLLALQGKVAGLDVTQLSGYASAPIKVELRGRASVDSRFTSDPLYIIDGVPLTVLELNSTDNNYYQGSSGFLQGGFGGPARGQSPFFNINPADIESIEVLKDADATAIYGSRGANGAILITTKKGKEGKTKFDLHIYQGVTKVTKLWQMMNTPQYLQMRREAFKNDGRDPNSSDDAYDLTLWDTTKYTDWQRALYGGTGKTTDVQGSVSGGNAHTTFRMGVGYNNTSNILTVSGADQRASMSFNLNHNTADQKFNIGLTTGYSFTQSDMISLPMGAVVLPPNAPSIFDSAGNLNYAGWGDQNASARQAFLFSSLKVPYNAKTNFLNGALTLSYQPARGVRISTNFGYNMAEANQKQFNTIASQDPARNPTGTSIYSTTNNKNWIIEPQVTYDVVAGKGKISALVGASVQQTHTDAIFNSGSGYTSDDLIQILSAAPHQSASNGGGEYKYAHLFGRLIYNYQNKYIVSLNGARDGSSRFGSGKQYGNFGSIGVAWIFTEETWIKEHLPFISFGKLRGSYGTTGSDAVGDYGYLSRWSYPTSTYTPYGGSIPLTPIQHANPNFHWQTNKKLEGGIDFGVLRDRIHANIAYYRNRCGDQLIALPTPDFTGFSSVIANWPALVQNDGWEFSVSATIVQRKDFNWTITFNTGINNNKLLSYPNIDQSPYRYSLIVGQPLNIVRRLHYIGVDPQTGKYAYQDKTKNGSIDVNPAGDDDRYTYNLTPKFIGGIGMNVSYKQFQVSMFFNIKKQIGANAYQSTGSGAGNAQNQPAEILGHEWKAPGDIASFSRFTTIPSDIYVGNSDLWYTDASYIRLSNLSVSYNLPVTYIRKIGMQGCSLFFHTNNLFVITKYKGPDPETQNFGGMPPSRVVVGGVNFNF